MSNRGDITIIGAGIAGLSASIALQKSGFSVNVFEKSESLENVGSGIVLWPNAWKVLDKLDMTGELLEHCVPLKGVITRDFDGNFLSSLDLQAFSDEMGVPLIAIGRKELLSVLQARV